MKKSKYDPKVEHDAVVAKIFSLLDDNKNEIDTVKTKKQRPTYSRGDKPDIILYPIKSVEKEIVDPKESEKAEIIIEVETESSINDKSFEKWKDFEDIAKTFYLVVHENCKDSVINICLDNDISAIILAYPILEDGTIGNINFELL